MEEGLRLFSFSTSILALPFTLVFATFFFASIKDGKRERASAPALIESILGILAIRAMPKMFRVNASRIITTMTDQSACRYLPSEFSKDQPVCEISPSFAIFTPSNLTVSTNQSLPGVVPTPSFTIDFYSQEDSLPW